MTKKKTAKSAFENLQWKNLSAETKKNIEAAVFNDVQQQLYRRQLMLGASDVNTSPLSRTYWEMFGYPECIDKYEYQKMYDRNPVAHRVVELYPAECWQSKPEILDSDAPASSHFETQIRDLFERYSIWSMLRRVDVLSGIGNFGILLMGVGDGKALNEPVDLSPLPNGEPRRYKLQYIRAFPHSQVSIAASEANKSNRRYGHPTMYRIQFQPNDLITDVEGFVDLSMQDVHWTRVIHIADNREVSEIYGIPRLQLVYNALLDLEKVFGSSGEMFWKGAYPGFVVEATDNQLGTVQIDSESIRHEIEKYENNLQRWMALKNAHVNPLSSSYSDPSNHIKTCLDQIALAVGCPMRILLGSERGELASSQDGVIWRKRLMERQNSYITPYIIRPVVQYLINCGVVDPPYDRDFHVEWPDLSTETKTEVYGIRSQQLAFLSQYKNDGLSEFISPADFLIKFCDFSDKECELLLANAKRERQKKLMEDAAQLMAQDLGLGGEEGAGGMGGMGGMGGDLGMGGMGGLGGDLGMGGMGGDLGDLGGDLGMGGMGGMGGADLADQGNLTTPPDDQNASAVPPV